MLSPAHTVANRLMHLPWRAAPPDGKTRTRWFALGDPQTSFTRVIDVLTRHGLLNRNGLLHSDVGLISVGDHFDYPGADGTVGRQGMRILHWLSAHPPDQVVLLAGNHDLSRVAELAYENEDTFGRARVLAREIIGCRKDPAKMESLKKRFEEEFPRIPLYNIAARDYVSFTDSQRSLVQRLLLRGRLQLACAARLPGGRSILITHAAVTTRQLDQLGMSDERDANLIARGLNNWLSRAIDRVREPWERNESAPLDLRPLCIAGTSGEVGGGFIYHRPANPERRGANLRWEFHPAMPRRFDPRTLPIGLVQACGHTGHRKCVKELGDWVTPEARTPTRGGLRTLHTDGTNVRYELGILDPQQSEATLYLIDGEIHHVAPGEYRLFPLSAAHPTMTATAVAV